MDVSVDGVHIMMRIPFQIIFRHYFSMFSSLTYTQYLVITYPDLKTSKVRTVLLQIKSFLIIVIKKSYQTTKIKDTKNANSPIYLK